MTGRHTADTVVVGAGILGATIACLLQSSDPARRVCVLDQGGERGAGTAASRRSLGVLTTWGGTPGQREFLADGLAASHAPGPAALLRAHHRQVPILVGAGPRTLHALAGSTTGPALGAAPAALIDAAAAAWGRPQETSGHAWASVAGGVPVLDVAAATDALLADVAARGGRVLRAAAVSLVELRAGRQHLTLADGSTVLTHRTVLATGPWPGPKVVGADLADPYPAAQGWRGKRVAALRIAFDPVPGAPLLYLPEDDLFLLPPPPPPPGEPAAARAWASFRCEQWQTAPEAPPAQAVLRATEEGKALLARRFPRLAGTADSCLTSVDGYTPDRTPIVDSPAPGLVRAVAGSGGGARFSLGMAQHVRRLLA